MRLNSHDSHPLSAAPTQTPRPTDARRPFRRGTRGPSAANAEAEPSDAGAALERQLLLVQTADPRPRRPFAARKALTILLSIALLSTVGAGIYAAAQWEQGRQESFTALIDRLGELEIASSQERADLLARQEAMVQQLQAGAHDNASLKASLARSDARLTTQSRALASLRKETASSLAAYLSLRTEQRAALETARGLWRSAARVFSAVVGATPCQQRRPRQSRIDY